MKTQFLGLSLLLVGLSLSASDVQKGYTFSDGNRVFASQLNSLVDASTILPGFYSGHAANTTLDTSDVFLVLSSGVYKRITAGNALYNNSVIITGQGEKTAPTNTDYLLIYDAAAMTLKKVSAGNLALGTTNLIATQPEATLPLLTSYLIVLNDGTNSRVTLSNLLAQFNYRALFTNLTLHTAPTNADRLLIWDSLNNSNKATTLAGLLTNLPPAAAVTNTDTFAAFTSNGVLSRVTLGQLSTAVSNNIIIQGSGQSQAWGRFRGTNAVGTYRPLNGFNISNVVRTAMGYYTLNFTNAMATTNYGVNLTLGTVGFGDGTGYVLNVTTQTLSSCSIRVWRDATSAFADPVHVHIHIIQ